MHFRLIPVLVLVAFMALAIRMGEFSLGVSNGGFAAAQTEVHEDMPPIPDVASNLEIEGDQADDIEQTLAESGEKVAQVNAEGAVDVEASDMEETESLEWKDATESEYEYSPVRRELYQELSDRRDALNDRERVLSTREALLEAAERELDQKLRELTAVRDEISALLQQQSEEEEARMASLVKIYEGMKAKDAANIFNTLDIDVLISVMGRMSERKSAPILAEMNPERARTVTILLAQQKQIPSIPPQ